MIRSLLGAIQFLTIVPVRARTASPGAAAFWFPLIGAVIGAVGATLFVGLKPWIGAPLAAVAAVTVWCFFTGGLHEDGLADVADAVRAGRSVDKMFAILKDPAIGVYGGLVLILSVMVRWQAVQELPSDRVIWIAAVAGALSRATMVILAYISRPARAGLGFFFASSLTRFGFVSAIAWSLLAAFSLGWRPAFAILLAQYLLIRLARAWFENRLGGITGDCLGATGLAVELSALVLLTCQRCSW
ncbi:MAG: adenosylcobinamide-GDP ribazoletransferase [Bryobacteraceae bacterium]